MISFYEINFKNLLTVFSTIYFVGLMGGFISMNEALGGLNFSPILFPILFLFNLFLFCFKPLKNILRVYFRAFVIFLLGILISVLFSFSIIDSVLTFLILCFNLFFAACLSVYLKNEEFLNILLNALILMLFLTFFVFLFNNSNFYYIDPLERDSFLGAFNIKGAFPHKIHAGIYCAIGFYFSLRKFNQFKNIKFLLLSVCFLLFCLASGSSLGFLVLILSIFILFSKNLINQMFNNFAKGVFSILFILIISSTSFFASQSKLFAYIAESLGRDPTLTGRTTIWDIGYQYIYENIFLGSGISAFFLDVPNSPASKIWSEMIYYQAPSFHNGYLQLLAETGLVGFFPFMIGLIISFYYAFRKNIDLFALIIMILILNSSAAILAVNNSLSFVVITFIFCKFLSNSEYR